MFTLSVSVLYFNQSHLKSNWTFHYASLYLSCPNHVCRINRCRSFGLDKRWLLMVDLEHREKKRRDLLNGNSRQAIIILRNLLVWINIFFLNNLFSLCFSNTKVNYFNRVLKFKKSCYLIASLRHLIYFRRYFQNCFNKNTKTFSVCWKSWRWKRTYKIYFGSSTRNLLHVRDCNCLEHHHFCHWSHCCSWECTPKFAEKHIFLNRKIKLCE